jgi:hypothetical protein
MPVPVESSPDPSCEPIEMIFGDHIQYAATVAPAKWIKGACGEAPGTVGSLVPNQYPLVMRVSAPNPSEDWWSAYRDLFAVTASIGERHTSSPDRAWLAVWEGHGFANSTTRIAWRDPFDDTNRHAREREQARLRDEDVRRNAAIRASLRQVPRFDLPNRTYHLLGGPVSAATRVDDPRGPETLRLPDLFWPDDRRWFVATDVDFWSLYIGGDHDFITELGRNVPTPTEIVTLDDQLVVED